MRALLQRLAVAALVAAALHACAPTPEPNRIRLSQADFSDLPGWSDGTQQAALPALKRSCAVLLRRAGDAAVGPGAVGGMVKDWRAPCAALAAAPDDAAAVRRVIEREFRPWRVTDGAGYTDGLFTGYYEAELHGSRHRSARYHIPILMRPPDLVTVDLGKFAPDLAGKRIAGRVVKGTLLPYPTRAAIERGALSGRKLEIAWVDNPVDAFFLHIQGSGRIVLNDGSVLQVGYAAANGRPYTPIGRVLIADGAIPRADMSMQAIRSWIDAHPARAQALMDKNASYVFFRVIRGDGPIGAEGVALTPGRSLAVDRRLMPLGAPVWLDTTYPRAPDRKLRRLMVAQDTGGAIRGAVRGDVFWGYGRQATLRAGKMQQTGRYFLLLPRTVRPESPMS